MLQQHSGRAADVGGVESVRLLGGERQQELAAAVFLGRRHRAVNLQGCRAGALGVAEDMQLGNIEAAEEVVRLAEVLVRFTASTHNDVDADEGMGHDVLDALDLLAEERRVVAATHEAQHLVAARLKGDMEVGHERPRTGHEGNDVVGEQVGLERRDAVAADALNGIEGADETDERLACAFAEVADVDARDDNLLGALRHGFLSLTDEGGDAAVAAAATGIGDGAVGAEVVAAVLYLQPPASAVALRTRRHEDGFPRLLAPEGGDADF